MRRVALIPFGRALDDGGGAKVMLPRNRRQFTMWAARRLRPVLPAHIYRSMYGLARLGYVPDYVHPRTFNEKVTSWLCRTKDPRIAERTDKLAVRAFVRRTAPWVDVPEVYAEADDAAAFAFDRLPDVSVLKANHGWHQHLVLRRPFDEGAARSRAAAWLATRHETVPWERHYLAIRPRLYAEQYLGDDRLPFDYKVFVLNGVARAIQVFMGRGVKLRRAMFDRDWRPLPVYRPLFLGGPPDVIEASSLPARPLRLDDLLRAAEALADDLPFVRADFYLIGDRIYFGELTYSPGAGYVPFHPIAFDRELGDLLDID